ncbi:phage portal protein [Bacillus infantis]|uniref:phage portal protein n=1 Tax=Bacillus infantis TaxID=324767 RepID=UPI003CF3CE37
MLTPEQIKKGVNEFNKLTARYQSLKNYYTGKHAILNRVLDDTSKPNNKIVVAYPTTIVDTAVSYLAGKPLSYTSKSNNEQFLNKLKEIFYINNEEDINAKIVKNMSIFGKTYELYWISNRAGEDIRFAEFSPLEMYVKTDSKGNAEYGIRPWKEKDENGNEITKVEAYDSEGIYYFVSRGKGDFILDPDEKSIEHFFGETPITIHQNNDEELGDFEQFIPMIDGLEKMLSDNSNEIEQWVNSYLKLGNMKGTKSEDIKKMKQDGVLLLENVKDAEFLEKGVNTDFQKNYFETLDNLIHEHSGTPKMTAEKFSSNLSSPALMYKLFNLESKSMVKERKMSNGIKKRLRFICTYLSKQGLEYSPMDITFSFSRNVPPNKAEITDMMVKLAPYVDRRTLLSMHPDIIDVDLVLKRLKEEGDAMDLQNLIRVNKSTLSGVNSNE